MQRLYSKKRRYHASFYMAGYAVEMAVKYKICKMYFFTQGFPETNGELQQYYRQIKTKGVRAIILKIHEIKNHDLAKLLLYSGEEYNIKKNHFTEWLIALQWSPGMRYKHLTIRKNIAENNLKAITILLQSIL